MASSRNWTNIEQPLCHHVVSLGHNELNLCHHNDMTLISDRPSSLSFVKYLHALRPRQNGRHFPDDIFKWIFLNENVWISIKISLKFVPKVPINNIPALVQIMAWRRAGDKPLSEPMMDSLLTHICVTRPQWVKAWFYVSYGNQTNDESKTYLTDMWINSHNTALKSLCCNV